MREAYKLRIRPNETVYEFVQRNRLAFAEREKEIAQFLGRGSNFASDGSFLSSIFMLGWSKAERRYTRKQPGKH